MKTSLFKVIMPIGILASIFVYSCTKEDDTEDEIKTEKVDAATVVASSANDDKSGGVYKGTLIGSTGSLKVVLVGDTKVAYMVFDGVSKTLTTTDLGSWASGQAVTNATFTSGDWKVVFSVSAAGTNPIISITVPGHTVAVAIVKEQSSSLTKSYEGTFTAGTASSNFNFVLKGDTSLTGMLKTTDNKIVNFKGSVVSNKITVTTNSGTGVITATGTVSGDVATGTFKEAGTINNVKYEVAGSWTAKKAL